MSGVDVWLTGCCVQFAVCVSGLVLCLVLMSGPLDVVSGVDVWLTGCCVQFAVCVSCVDVWSTGCCVWC